MLRIVLDTNVALDWLVFDDARCRALGHALEARQFSLLSDALCLAELKEVIARRTLRIKPDAQESVIKRYVGLAEMMPWRPPAADPPKCRDLDDQPFLELAERGRAHVLVSRDKELLRLDVAMRRICATAVLEPSGARDLLGLA